MATEEEAQLGKLPFAPEFTQVELLERIKQTPPGEALDLSDTTASAIRDAVAQFSAGPAVPAQAAFDLGPHVTVQTNWWGVEVGIDHEGMTALQAGGGATATLLTAIGVTALVAAIIAGVIGIWSAFDRGNGVIFYVTWVGVHWFTPR
jgi:hypothetical protein